jgi:4'-phosphopantetheinyl transferase EntD
MIELLLSADVRGCESFGERADALFPEEEEAVLKAIPARRAEFRTSRACARQALAGLGLPPGPIPRGLRGEPQWPKGVVGSITHCSGYRAAAVAWARDVTGVGIDAEPNRPLPAGVLEQIARAEEIAAAALLPHHLPVAWDRLLFCAKEAVFKTWYPRTGRWLDFSQVRIDVDPSGWFLAEVDERLLAETGFAGSPFSGRWMASDDLVLVAVAEQRRRGPDAG